MGTIFQRHGKLALAVGLVALIVSTSVLVGYFASRASALGMPGTNPLYYSGLLTDTAGKPLTNPQTIVLDLYDASTAGNKKCSTTSIATPLTQGRFRIALSTACVTALQDNPDLWIEVSVGTTPMARTKIGAVPYVLAPDMIKVDGDASLTIHSNSTSLTPNSKMLTMKTGTTSQKEVFTVNNAGKVGVGTSNPEANFHIVKANAGSVQLPTDTLVSLENDGNSRIIHQMQKKLGNVAIWGAENGSTGDSINIWLFRRICG